MLVRNARKVNVIYLAFSLSYFRTSRKKSRNNIEIPLIKHLKNITNTQNYDIKNIYTNNRKILIDVT
jgi:hypothetical protein